MTRRACTLNPNPHPHPHPHPHPNPDPNPNPNPHQASEAAAERRRLAASLAESEARAAQARGAARGEHALPGEEGEEGRRQQRQLEQQQLRQQLEEQLAAMAEAQAQLERGEAERVRLASQLEQVEEEARLCDAVSSERLFAILQATEDELDAAADLEVAAAELPDVMPDADSRSGADCNRAASPPPPPADLIEF